MGYNAVSRFILFVTLKRLLNEMRGKLVAETGQYLSIAFLIEEEIRSDGFLSVLLPIAQRATATARRSKLPLH